VKREQPETLNLKDESEARLTNKTKELEIPEKRD
jgi:hypothetical protein